MSHLISPEYQELMQSYHDNTPHFGSSMAKQMSPGDLLKLTTAMDTTDVLDYGCGKGKLGLQLPFPIHHYDPGIPKWSTPPDPHDIVICVDVLEHVEPECTEAVLDDLARVTKQVGIFAVCLIKANKHLPDGRNAHINLKTKETWLALLRKRFDVLDWALLGQLKDTEEDVWLRVAVSPKGKPPKGKVVVNANKP